MGCSFKVNDMINKRKYLSIGTFIQFLYVSQVNQERAEVSVSPNDMSYGSHVMIHNKGDRPQI